MTQVFDGGVAHNGRRDGMPMRGGRSILRHGLRSGLVGTALWLVAPNEAAAGCWNTGSGYSTVYNCWLDSGSYSSQQSYTVTPAPPIFNSNGTVVTPAAAVLPFSLTSEGDIYFTASSSQNSALSVSTQGILPDYSIPGAYSPLVGYLNTSGLEITNNGSLELTGTSGSIGNNVYGLYAEMLPAGTGSTFQPPTYLQPSNPLPQALTVTNTGSINVSLGGVTVSGGGGLFAQAVAGYGADSGGVTITNSGQIGANLTVQQGYGGIIALGQGGDGWTSTAGGDAFASSVTSSGSVSVYATWGWDDDDSNSGLYGVLAQSYGGSGGDSAGGNSDGEGDGGEGGSALSAAVTLTAGADVTLEAYSTAPTSSSYANPSAGVSAAVIGGNGGDGWIYGDDKGASAGDGGHAGMAQITVTDANVKTTGDTLPGLLAFVQGGSGGTTPDKDCSRECQSEVNGGDGNDAGAFQDYAASIQVTAATRSVTISTAGKDSPAVAAIAQGGAGGAGGDANDLTGAGHVTTGGDGGDGGDIDAPIAIQLAGTSQNPVKLKTSHDSSPGIMALSTGGYAEHGGNSQRNGHDAKGGEGGDGGSAGDISISLASTAITSSGTSSYGIVAVSQGRTAGHGGQGEGGTEHGYGGDGGDGGEAGSVTVTLDAASSIATSGNAASGIVAQSFSGGGGEGGAAGGNLGAYAGSGGDGGDAGDVTVTNGGAISTEGDAARGILAQSIPGVGGSGGETGQGFHGDGGGGASGGAAGSVTVQHDGSITTTGDYGQGILAQSIGGAGGAGGDASGVFKAVGGDATNSPFDSAGNTVTIGTSSGSITTSGTSAIGILGQSIGGGGGDGGGATGGAAVGGSGGGGGDGGSVTGTSSDTAITTSGDYAHAYILQSIGGGGGNAGNASAAAPFDSLAVGGSGGDGGDGGSVAINIADSTITTSGAAAAGLTVQSIGGGGGTGGNAFDVSVGVGFAVSAAVGGSGGDGGDAGTAQVQMTGGSIATGQDPLLTGGCDYTTQTCNTLPVDSYGVVVQSIGGGGGSGGSTSAMSLALSTPTPALQIGVSLTAGIGGTGGNGGDGGAAQFALSEGGQIVTAGQGATAVLVQSVGGGGGAGGDSSATAMVVGYSKTYDDALSLSFEGAFTIGGDGGPGGDGDDVHVALSGQLSDCPGDSCTVTPDAYGNPTSIKTYGDYANGVTAQSIGGGGGNAGFGSSTTQSAGTGVNASLAITVGSTGGVGGEGGEVRIDQFASNSVTTLGSGAIGLLAQSIGGGGGASQGGSYSAGVGFSLNGSNFNPGATVNVGSDGGTGGNGGEVVVSAQGLITTSGGSATGILAQSIGGGGGLGGSAGSDGSADNPVTEGLDARQAESNIESLYENAMKGNPSGSLAANLEVSVGGDGGTAGDGGDVEVQLYAPITTTGDWASGIVAQSVGGGGGTGGTAAASGTGGLSYINMNRDVAVGGTGGSAGDGGSVTVELNEGNQGGSFDNNTSITTTGYGAAAVIAQSVGGGGGIGADGSDSASGEVSLGVGYSKDGTGGTGGDGGAVLVNYYNPQSTTITTAGDTADGVILQSIGGGGGMASVGSGVAVDTQWYSATLSVNVGGDEGSSGDGGTVTFEPNDPDTPIVISTTGNDSFGILAQSIGGGGGIASTQLTSISDPDLTLGGSNQFDVTNHADTVSVTLGSQGSIITTGIGSHGIVAQSIGGGGGLLRFANESGDTPSLGTVIPDSFSTGVANDGNGGTVTVEVDGSVAVSGAGAIGVLAQSVGSGGGLVMQGDTFYAGTTNFEVDGSQGSGNPVTVTVNGSVSATGANGIGVFAQSTGYDNAKNSQVSVVVNGSVMGGGGQAAMPNSDGSAVLSGSSAIQIDSPNGSNEGNGNVVTVNAGGSVNTVLGTSGTAIIQTAQSNKGYTGQIGYTYVTNAGTVTGSVYLGSGTFTNVESGVHNSGADVQGDVVNRGVVNIGMPDEVRTTHAVGYFTQTSAGQLGVSIDSLAYSADYLTVDNTASIDGLIVPAPISLLPGTVPVVESGGTMVSTADALDSLLFRWDASQSGNILSITPSQTFRPAGVSLNDSQASLADYYGRAWDNVDRAFAARFAELSQINDAGDYKTALDAWSGKAAFAQSLALANSAGTILGSSMSCPVFAVGSVLLREDDCVWARLTGNWTSQSATGDTQGYDVSSATYRIGAQHQIAPDWYLGSSLGFGRSWADMDGGSSGDGDVYDGSVTVKHFVGPWQFAGSIAFAGGSFDVARQVEIPGISSETVMSDPSIFLAGGRLRAAYEFAFNDWYIRPYGDLDVVYTNMPGFQEEGDDMTALDVRSSNKTSVALSPMVEFGGRLDLSEQSTLRAYAAFGLSYQPDNTRAIDASFIGASAADGTFTNYIDSPEWLGRVNVGVQLFGAGGYELKGEYAADIGDSFLSQSASARFAYHF